MQDAAKAPKAQEAAKTSKVTEAAPALDGAKPKPRSRRRKTTDVAEPADVAEVPDVAEAIEAPVPVVDAEMPRKTDDERRDEALDLIVGTVDALMAERGVEEKIWGSMIKQALKRRKPGFNESYYGFRSFNGMLEDAAQAGMLELERDEKSGGYLVRLSVPED